MSDEPLKPPPPGRGVTPQARAEEPVPVRSSSLEIPPNQFGQLVKAGFGFGIGLSLGFAVVGAISWLIVALLVAATFAS